MKRLRLRIVAKGTELEERMDNRNDIPTCMRVMFVSARPPRWTFCVELERVTVRVTRCGFNIARKASCSMDSTKGSATSRNVVYSSTLMH